MGYRLVLALLESLKTLLLQLKGSNDSKVIFTMCLCMSPPTCISMIISSYLYSTSTQHHTPSAVKLKSCPNY